MAYCGICGSDLHEYVDGPHAIPVGEPHPASGMTEPLVLGHEFCGTVTAVGPGVSGPAPGSTGSPSSRTIVTVTIGLDEVVSDGFEALLGGSDQIKVLVRPKGVR